jgi:hypothetical protein
MPTISSSVLPGRRTLEVTGGTYPLFGKTEIVERQFNEPTERHDDLRLDTCISFITLFHVIKKYPGGDDNESHGIEYSLLPAQARTAKA